MTSVFGFNLVLSLFFIVPSPSEGMPSSTRCVERLTILLDTERRDMHSFTSFGNENTPYVSYALDSKNRPKLQQRTPKIRHKG